MDLGISNRVALVTGASAGIGAAVARRLAQEGCKLVLIARRPENLNAVRESLSGRNARDALIFVCDVTKPDEVSKAVSSTLQQFGAVDILINNAGGLTTGDLRPFDELSDENFIDTYALNVMSAVRFVRAVLPSMRQQRWGRVVSISSESALQPDLGGADYNSAKAALNALSKTLSKAYATEGILFNVVSPAFTLTELVRGFIAQHAETSGLSLDAAQSDLLVHFRPNIAVKRPGTPEETADAVAFLASDRASFINGSILRVDGGSVIGV